MNRALPEVRDLARRLIECEMRAINSSDPKKENAFSVCEKLRPHLATLTGMAGFRALLLRALVLAIAENQGLRTLSVKADGMLGGMDVYQTQVGPDAFYEGAVGLLTQLLGLLEAFIGENLTLHLVGEIWPQLSINKLGSGEEAAHEKTE